MKIQIADKNVVASQGLQESTGFTIRASAHAFKALSSTLYSDKIRAVLREIGCNAQDAHIAVGTPDRPIRVKVPNSLDDQFYIQDWGPGLSHEDIMGLYSTYFESTKQDTNDQTGAFGLGSKSPFSYTDSFTVVSANAGKKRTYTIYMSNKGAPITSLMTEEDADADWPSGLRVGFAVPPKDYSEFHEKAQTVFQWFRVPPEMKGRGPIEPVKYSFESREYSVREQGVVGEVVALMGNVAYPVELDAIGATSQAKGSMLAVRTMAGLVLNLPIGDAQVALNRETLQYDKDTVALLRRLARTTMQSATLRGIQAVEAAEKGGWAEACALESELRSVFTTHQLYSFGDLAMEFGDVDAKRAADMQALVGRKEVEMPDGFGLSTAGRLIKQGRRGIVNVWPVFRGSTSFGRTADLPLVPETAVMYGAPAMAAARAKRAVAEGKYKQVLLATSTKDKKATDAQMRDDAVATAALLGIKDVLDVSTFDPPDAQPGVTRVRKGKKWVPTLPVGRTFPVVTAAGKSSDELGNIASLFVCDGSTSSWGNTSYKVRYYAGGRKKDERVVDGYHWDTVWSKYVMLAQRLNLPDTRLSYALLRPSEIRSLAVERLGWVRADKEIAAYAQRADVRQALLDLVDSVSTAVAAPASVYGSSGWMTSLSCMWADDKSKFTPGVVKLLNRVRLVETLNEMAAERKKGRTASGRPPELDWYAELSRAGGFPNLNITMKNSVTIEDMDQAFEAKFPLTKYVNCGKVRDAIARGDASVIDTLEFVLSKEV